jgi:hypothetical protein
MVDAEMVLQVPSHRRAVMDDVDSQRSQCLARADAGEQQELRRVCRPDWL